MAQGIVPSISAVDALDLNAIIVDMDQRCKQLTLHQPWTSPTAQAHPPPSPITIRAVSHACVLVCAGVG